MTFVPRLWQNAVWLQDRPIYSGPIFKRRPERNLASFKMPVMQDPHFHFSVPRVSDVAVDQKNWPKNIGRQKRSRKFTAKLTEQQQVVRQKILDGNCRRREGKEVVEDKVEEKEAVEEEKKEVVKEVEEECCICLDRPAATTLLPCRHKCVCATCSTKVEQCPLCRQVIVAHTKS